MNWRGWLLEFISWGAAVAALVLVAMTLREMLWLK